MKIRTGTIMAVVPKEGVPKDRCIVCTGPKPHVGCDHDHVGDAFLVGVIEGALTVLTTRAHLPYGRAPLCIDHETRLREMLVRAAQGHPEVFDRLGIEYTVA